MIKDQVQTNTKIYNNCAWYCREDWS